MNAIVLWFESKELSIIHTDSLARICVEKPSEFKEGLRLRLKHKGKIYDTVVVSILKRKKDAEKECNEELRKKAISKYCDEASESESEPSDEKETQKEPAKPETEVPEEANSSSNDDTDQFKEKSKNRYQQLEKKYSSLKRKFQALEDRVIEIEEKIETRSSTDNDLLDAVSHFKDSDIQDTITTLALKQFTKDELINKSVSGKKSHLGQKPPLDQEKYKEVMRAVMSKTGCSKDIFNAKFRNYQKVLRRKAK